MKKGSVLLSVIFTDPKVKNDPKLKDVVGNFCKDAFTTEYQSIEEKVLIPYCYLNKDLYNPEFDNDFRQPSRIVDNLIRGGHPYIQPKGYQGFALKIID